MSARALHWLETVSNDVPPGDEWLSAAERRTLEGLAAPKRRADWRLGRWTAKQAAAALLGVDLERVTVRVRANGTPELVLDEEPAPLAVSLSHSGGRALCALAPPGTALGCDLETIAARSAAFEADHLVPEEREIVRAAADHDLAVTLVWSAKESAAKALGEGWRLDSYELRVHVAPPRPPAGWSTLRVTDARTAARGGAGVDPLLASAGSVLRGWWRAENGQVRTVVSVPTTAPVPLLPSSPAYPE